MIVGLSVPFMKLRCPTDLEDSLDTFLTALADQHADDNGRQAFRKLKPEFVPFLEGLIKENLAPWKKEPKGLKNLQLVRSEWHDDQLHIEVTTS